jgi:hypothetical protein
LTLIRDVVGAADVVDVVDVDFDADFDADGGDYYYANSSY